MIKEIHIKYMDIIKKCCPCGDFRNLQTYLYSIIVFPLKNTFISFNIKISDFAIGYDIEN